MIEPDATVRSAILDVFSGLAHSHAAQDALNAALASARDRNRAILKRYVDRYFTTTLLVNGRLPSGPGYMEVPVGKLSAEELAPLETTANIMAALIRAGAKIPDLSQTYCVECKFGLDDKSVDLSHTKFDGAFLRRADFRNADLSCSSFHNADLVQTWFTSANLRGAKLTADIPTTPWQEMAGIASNNLLLMFGANFACADLYEADFAGRPIFTFIYNNPVFGAGQHNNFAKANLRKTKLRLPILACGAGSVSKGVEGPGYVRYSQNLSGQYWSTGWSEPIYQSHKWPGLRCVGSRDERRLPIYWKHGHKGFLGRGSRV